MFQSGIDLPALDVSYVSSMSWYILNVTGLQGIQALILGQAGTIHIVYITLCVPV